MRWFLSQTVVKWLRQIRILGWVRFRIIRYCYKIMWVNSPYNDWWDFVLKWMGQLKDWQKPIKVLDVGSTDSLLIYELRHRGYELLGIDQRPYQEKNLFTAIVDILNPPVWWTAQSFDYVVAISSIEHIGLGAYKDNKNNNGDRIALMNLKIVLKDNGYLILGIPNRFRGSPSGRGYFYFDLLKLIDGLFRIVYFEERNNQICTVLIKTNG